MRIGFQGIIDSYSEMMARYSIETHVKQISDFLEGRANKMTVTN